MNQFENMRKVETNEICLRDKTAPNRAGRVEPFFNGSDHTLLRLPGDGTEHILDNVEYSGGGRDTR
jgi:hypothetical protein